MVSLGELPNSIKRLSDSRLLECNQVISRMCWKCGGSGLGDRINFTGWLAEFEDPPVCILCGGTGLLRLTDFRICDTCRGTGWATTTRWQFFRFGGHRRKRC